MSHRRKKDYKAVFRAVLELAPSLAVEEMVTDFEEAIWRAAAHALPDVAARGCNFHFSKALLRQVGELGLKRAYCKQGVVQDYIKWLFALPYLPKEHIRPTFNWIAEGANDALKPLISYVDKQWFHKFTPEDWCVYRQTTRTDNDVEGWHNRLNMKARTANLNFYVLVQLLKGEANMMPLLCQLLKEDKIKKWQHKQTAATQGKLWKQYKKWDISTHQLLKQLGHVAAPTEVKKWYPPQPRLSWDLRVPGQGSPTPIPPLPFPGTYGFPAKVLRTPAFPGTYGFPVKAPPPLTSDLHDSETLDVFESRKSDVTEFCWAIFNVKYLQCGCILYSCQALGEIALVWSTLSWNNARFNVQLPD